MCISRCHPLEVPVLLNFVEVDVKILLKSWIERKILWVFFSNCSHILKPVIKRSGTSRIGAVIGAVWHQSCPRDLAAPARGDRLGEKFFAPIVTHYSAPLARGACAVHILRTGLMLTHFCPQLRSTFAVRESASLAIMEAPRVPPLNPSETIVL